MPSSSLDSMRAVYGRRDSRRFADRLRRWLEPPAPYILNPAEPNHFPMGRHNLYIGGAGRRVDGSINLDLVAVPGVDVIADAHHLPFRDEVFGRVECDAVLEHVAAPERVVREIERVVEPGGYAHLVTPFCHPFHEYPKDYRRFTIDGLKQLAGGMEVVAEGWRTGPAATILVFTIEWAKLLFPWRPLRAVAHGVTGWLLFPLRYLDLLFFDSPRCARLGNHCYLWLRKSER